MQVGTRRGASAIRKAFSSAVTLLRTRTRHGASRHGASVISTDGLHSFGGQSSLRTPSFLTEPFPMAFREAENPGRGADFENIFPSESSLRRLDDAVLPLPLVRTSGRLSANRGKAEGARKSDGGPRGVSRTESWRRATRFFPKFAPRACLSRRPARCAKFVFRNESQRQLPLRYVAAPATVGGASASPFPRASCPHSCGHPLSPPEQENEA